MSELDLSLALIGGLLLVLGIAGGLIKNRGYISQPTLALAFGVLIGPGLLGILIHPGGWIPCTC